MEPLQQRIVQEILRGPPDGRGDSWNASAGSGGNGPNSAKSASAG